MAHPRSAYDEKLASILRRAALIFAEKGYHQASIRDIARATHVSLSGLYYYFQSKEELLFLIQADVLSTLIDDLEVLLSQAGEPRQKLRLLVESYLRYFLSNTAEMTVLAHEADSLTGEFRTAVIAQKRRLTEMAAELLAELRPEARFDRRVSVFALFGMMNWIYTWYRPHRDVPVEQLAEQMSRLFLDGFLDSSGEPVSPEDAAAPRAVARPSLWEASAVD